jgi:hypothetical protein
LRRNRPCRGDDERGFLTFLDGVLANATPAGVSQTPESAAAPAHPYC